MQALFVLLILIYIFSININVFVRNHKDTTKIYAKIWFVSLNIPYQKIISKSLIKEKNKKRNEKLQDLINLFSVKDFIYYFCKTSVVKDLYLIKYEDMYDCEINIYQNTIIMLLFYQISGYANATFKSIYSEDYRVIYDSKRKDEIDGYLHIKTHLFGIIWAYILYFTKKRRMI